MSIETRQDNVWRVPCITSLLLPPICGSAKEVHITYPFLRTATNEGESTISTTGSTSSPFSSSSSSSASSFPKKKERYCGFEMTQLNAYVSQIVPLASLPASSSSILQQERFHDFSLLFSLLRQTPSDETRNQLLDRLELSALEVVSRSVFVYDRVQQFFSTLLLPSSAEKNVIDRLPVPYPEVLKSGGWLQDFKQLKPSLNIISLLVQGPRFLLPLPYSATTNQRWPPLKGVLNYLCLCVFVTQGAFLSFGTPDYLNLYLTQIYESPHNYPTLRSGGLSSMWRLLVFNLHGS